MNACTDYFAICGNGQWSNKMNVSPGTKCFNGVLVLPSECSTTPTIPVTPTTTPAPSTPTPAPSTPTPAPSTPTPVPSTATPAPECSFTNLLCTDASGASQTECSKYYRTCNNGVLSEIMATPTGMKCYQGALVNENDTPCVPINYDCDWTGIHCTNAQGNEQKGICTRYYVTCKNNVTSTPRIIPDSLYCLDNDVVTLAQCLVRPDDTCFFCDLL